MSKKAQPVTAAKIEPTITPVSQVSSSYQPRAGWYHLVKLDPNGNEMFGTDVSIAPVTFNRTYKKLTEGDNPTYLVKKNPNK